VERLISLGMQQGTKEAGQRELTLLGRNGQIRWCQQHLRENFAYVSAGSLICVPPAHCLLTGIMADVFKFCLKTTANDLPDPRTFDNHLFLLGHDARRFLWV
jgi:hypothetical protein